MFSRSSGRGACAGRTAHAYARSSGLFSAPHELHVSVVYSPRDRTYFALALGLVRQSREKQPVRNGEHRLVRAGAERLGLAVRLERR